LYNILFYLIYCFAIYFNYSYFPSSLVNFLLLVSLYSSLIIYRYANLLYFSSLAYYLLIQHIYF